ncbi:MAG: class I SAM-dependent RNA methyltransferase [Hyphomonadaceae bacterium]
MRELTFSEIGARGDAVAEGAGAPLYAPFALPGERVRARVIGERAEVIELLAPSEARVAPACPHFGRCGGCQLQHWAEAPYLEWKREQVVRALARRGIEADVAPTIAAWGEGRRRAGFHAQRTPKGVRLGFIARGGAKIVPVDQCPVLTPGLAAKLPALRAVSDLFAPARGELTLACLESDAGVDVNVKGAGRAAALDRANLEAAAELARTHDLARLSLDGEPLLALRTPRVAIGLASIKPPPGAFLQATRAGEDVLAAHVMRALHGASRVIDLFSGCGTFALRAAEMADVHAVEGEEEMLAALKRGADGAGGRLKSVTTQRRDLLRTPVSALELKRFDAAILDPPRAGARLQAQQIAASRISRVASVSCDPATFARDARVLIDAGFTLKDVTPVDQFRWSAQIEVTGAFAR